MGNGCGKAGGVLAKVLPAQHGIVIGDGRAGLPRLLETIEPVEREGQGVVHRGDDAAPHRQPGAQGRYSGPERVEHDQGFGFGVVQVGQQLGFHVERVDHDRYGPGLEYAPEGLHRLGEVGQHDGHASARLDAGAAQRSGETFGPFAQRPVGKARVLEDKRLPVGIAIGRGVEKGIERRVEQRDVARRVGSIMTQPGPGRVFGRHACAFCERLPGVFRTVSGAETGAVEVCGKSS